MDIFVLGPDSYEMQAIEDLLKVTKQTYGYAVWPTVRGWGRISRRRIHSTSSGNLRVQLISIAGESEVVTGLIPMAGPDTYMLVGWQALDRNDFIGTSILSKCPKTVEETTLYKVFDFLELAPEEYRLNVKGFLVHPETIARASYGLYNSAIHDSERNKVFAFYWDILTRELDMPTDELSKYYSRAEELIESASLESTFVRTADLRRESDSLRGIPELVLQAVVASRKMAILLESKRDDTKTVELYDYGCGLNCKIFLNSWAPFMGLKGVFGSPEERHVGGFVE
jgi:hypothetical protein